MKIEMHAHTDESSPCAHVPAERIPSMYRAAGYDGIVITDHYCRWARARSGAKNAQEYADHFLSGYLTAKRAARQTGFTVLLGAEVNPPKSPNDYLLYGADEGFFRKHLELCDLTLKELSALCRQNGILLFQAHPFRTYCSPSDPRYLDGAESYNGNIHHDNQNARAASWASENHLIPSSGSDFHTEEDLAMGGIETDGSIGDIRALCQILREGSYRLLRP